MRRFPRGGAVMEYLKEYFKSAWNFADQIFSPQHKYLGDEDNLIERMYRARSIIGALMLVAIGLRYHHPAKDLVKPLAPVLGGVTAAMLVALACVVPGAAAVIVITDQNKRVDAWRQMRYPLGALLAWITLCFIGIGYVRGMHWLLTSETSFGLIIIIYILMCVLGPWILAFVTRAIYLVTTGVCRLGDGHPLLPPVVGAIIAWALAITGLASSNGARGDPALVAVLVLWTGPISITALSVAEVLRLRKRYPTEFPFRDGPIHREPVAEPSGG
jgi:hypothetical protein